MSKLCSVSDIPEGGAKGYEHKGCSYIVTKLDGQIYTYVNRCPHLGAPLNWAPDDFLDPDGDLIRCSTHGALFQIENGRCVSGPCLGQSLQASPCHTQDGYVLLSSAS